MTDQHTSTRTVRPTRAPPRPDHTLARPGRRLARSADCWPAAAPPARPQARPRAAQGESITLYSGQHEQTTNGLVTAFEKQTGIKVNVRNDDEDTLANLIAVQGSHTQGDVFFTENSPPLEFLQEKGLLSKVSPATLADTPATTTGPTATGSGCPPGSA